MTTDKPEPEPEGRFIKVNLQIDLVVNAFGRADIRIGVQRLRNGDLDFMYHRGFILVRDAYLDRIAPIVGGGPYDGVIDGVTLWALPEPPEGEQPEPERGRIFDVIQAVEAIEDELGVGVATPNHVFYITPAGVCPATEPDVPPGVDVDPFPGVCEGHHGRGVFVDVIDTGILGTADRHPWLHGVGGDPDPFQPPQDIPPYTGHGTFVSGVLRCQAPGAHVRVANLLHYAGAQLEHAIIKQVDRALADSPDIISLSAGATTWKGLPPIGFEALWQRYRHFKGVQLVAAAGNNSDRRPFWPAAFPQVVSVGALSANWRGRASFSDYGGWVDVYAPGEGLINAYAWGRYVCQEPPNIGQVRNFGGMARWSGTSFSTPLVAGLIAARMSRTGESSRQAAAALLAKARAQFIPGVGPVLYPCEWGDEDGDGCCGHGRYHGGHGRHHGCGGRGCHGCHRGG